MQDTVWTKYIGPEIMDLRYHPSGDYIVVVNYNQIFILDAHNGEIVRQMEDNIGKIHTMAISASGDSIATGNAYGYIILWDFNTGDSIATIDDYYSLERYCDPPNVYDIEFSSDGNYLITCGAFAYNSEKMVKGVVLIHDIKKDALVKATIDSSMTCVAVSPVGDYFATGTLYEGTVDLWDIGTWEKVKTLGVHYAKISDIDFNNDGKYLVSGSSNEGAIKQYDLESKSLYKSWNYDEKSNYVNSISFANNDKWLIVGGGVWQDWFTKIWSFENQSFIKEYPYQGKLLDVSPNSHYIVLAFGYDLFLLNIKDINTIENIEKTLDSFSITPNPSQDNISINYTLSNSSYVNIDILDQEGILIENVINKYQNNGNYIEKYNTSNLTSGIYLCRIKTPYHTESVKFIIVK